LVQALESEGLPYWAKQTTVQKRAVDAWILHAQGRRDEALGEMKNAADAEDALDKHPVTPGAVLPARELYADMLLAEGHHERALEAYEATLLVSPNRFNSLSGAGIAAGEAGREHEARRYFARLLEIAGSGDTTRVGLGRARAMAAEPGI
jgi:tetratricopeptide (TPR) repeat protein